ncbi:cupin domain-containing protein [Thermodesulfobacteriota bacterium]
MSKYGEARVLDVDEIEAITEIPKHRDCVGYGLLPQDTGVSFSFGLTEMRPGGEAEPDAHEGREHCFFILSGVGLAKVNGKEFTLKSNQCLWIPPGAEHDLKPVGHQTLRFLVITFPAFWENVE